MAIIRTPFADPASAYLPVRWVTEVITTLQLEVAVVDISVNGSVVATKNVRPFEDAGGTQKRFNIDIQDVLQRLSAPFSNIKPDVLGDFNDSYVESANDSFGVASIEVTYLFRNPTTNLLQDIGLTDTSVAINWYAGTRQQEEAQNFDEFLLLPTSFRRFLTNAPTRQKISLGENAYITHVERGANTLRIQTLTNDNVFIDTGFLNTGALNTLSLLTLGIGPANIEQITFTTGSVNINNPNVGYYLVDVGQLVMGVFVPYSEQLRFDLVQKCKPTDIRLQFLNRLGGMDAYTFRASKEYQERSTNDLAQRGKDNRLFTGDPLQTPELDEVSVFKINSQSRGVFEVTSQNVDSETAALLAELITSPLVYRETSNGFVPVYVQSGQNTIDNSEGLTSFQLIIFESNSKVIQRI